ncbi:Predicted arabinose efflux permease, MFS family [Sinosporangium album]|uniref:Predicted arabinose efflux permease, MFS family n=1 Tax=Sinosporangium album TaxID=504805 RepID=A0A1G7SFT0_9ACTN|nr:MFS transporter [Sinosporangium album]SDG21925.1 Predicted arabinose efflux permease, MFS family [Sinosporangium album]
MAVHESAWAPLKLPVFRALWIAQLVSNLGSWMQMVGAQWLLVDAGPTVLSLVQTATMLPVMLLALPAGVLADLSDRRRLLIATQVALLVVATVLAGLTLAGLMNPPLLLALTFLIGCGSAVMGPAWQAIQPELVPRDQLSSAAALGGVNMNSARAIGPAVGGLLVAWAGPGWVFALNALSFLAVTLALVRWDRPADERPDESERERAIAAFHAGTRYVRHAPGVIRILLRVVLFIPAATALMALLPIVAGRYLGMGANGYGVLLGAIGVGAVVGAFTLPKARGWIGRSGLLAAGGVAAAAGVLVTAAVRQPVLVMVGLLLYGMAWIAVLSTLNAALQMLLPSWVRSRGLAVYLVVFQGGSAVSAPLWGLAADAWGVPLALAGSAVLLLVGALSVQRWPLPGHEYDRTVSTAWPQPHLVLEPPTDRPVLVTLEYRVPEGNGPEFMAAMRHVEKSRRRTGAYAWGLFVDGADPSRYIEVFQVRSWSEHMAQHNVRMTAADQAWQDQAWSFAEGAPVVTHAIAVPQSPGPPLTPPPPSPPPSPPSPPGPAPT